MNHSFTQQSTEAARLMVQTQIHKKVQAPASKRATGLSIQPFPLCRVIIAKAGVAQGNFPPTGLLKCHLRQIDERDEFCAPGVLRFLELAAGGTASNGSVNRPELIHNKVETKRNLKLMNITFGSIEGEYQAVIQKIKRGVLADGKDRIWIEMGVYLDGRTPTTLSAKFTGPFCAGSHLHRIVVVLKGSRLKPGEQLDLQSLVGMHVWVRVIVKLNGSINVFILSALESGDITKNQSEILSQV